MEENVGLVYTTLGGLGSNVLAALFWLALASILTIDDYGLANYYMAIANVAAGVGIVGLNLTLMTYLAKGEKELLYEANSFTLITGIITAIIISLFYWAAGIIAAATIFFNMTLSELLGKKKYRQYAIISIIQQIAQISLSLILFYPLGILGILLGYFIGAFIFSYKYLNSIRKNFTLTFKILKTKRNFAIHSYGYNLIGKRLANHFDKVIIGALFGYYALGLYQLGFQFYTFFTLVPTSLSQYLLPEESSGTNKKEIKTIGLLLSVAVAILGYLTTPYIITNFFTTFIPSIELVQVMSIAVIPSTIVAILTSTYLGNEKSKTVLIAGIIYLISLFLGLIILEAIMGVIGFAVAIILAQSIQAVYLLSKK
jgi:O-antigen/teichoic acid export membrane protein